MSGINKLMSDFKIDVDQKRSKLNKSAPKMSPFGSGMRLKSSKSGEEMAHF